MFHGKRWSPAHSRLVEDIGNVLSAEAAQDLSGSTQIVSASKSASAARAGTILRAVSEWRGASSVPRVSLDPGGARLSCRAPTQAPN